MVHGIENINQYINFYDIKRFMESMTENQVVKYSVGVLSIILCIGIYNYHYSNNYAQNKNKKRRKIKDKNGNNGDDSGKFILFVY